VSAALLSPTAQVGLIKLVGALVELPGDVQRLLCHGSEDKGDRSAATHFAGRPPQLTTTAAVAEYLGIDEVALSALRGTKGLRPAADGLGHDMDQVLRLQQDLARLLSAEDVDAVTGVEGLALALIDLKVLSALKTADGTLVGIHLESVELLLCHLQERIEVRMPCPGDAVPLLEAVTGGADLPQLAWVVAQVRGGSLRAYGWPTPHRLTDLVVDRERLEELCRLNS
jgi:hypothetical protein